MKTSRRKWSWRINVDESDTLDPAGLLFRLLSVYAEPGALNRETWQGRVMEFDGMTGRDLSRLHGELIAAGWLEQDTGATRAAYRVTLQGLRAYRNVERQPQEVP